MFRSQLDAHLTFLIKSCDGNVHKEKRYRFRENALNRAVDAYQDQKSREHKRRLSVWLKEMKKHEEGKTPHNLMEKMLGDKRKMIIGEMKKTFLPKRPKFRTHQPEVLVFLCFAESSSLCL